MKLFVSVGTQLPFPRLVEAVGAMIAHHPDLEGLAQVGDDAGAGDEPRLHCVRSLDGDAFRRAVADCDVFLSHAGIGSVLLARELRRPHVVVPRDAAQGEHRNDHQRVTARWLEAMGGVHVVWSMADLEAAVFAAASDDAGGPGSTVELQRLQAFVQSVAGY